MKKVRELRLEGCYIQALDQGSEMLWNWSFYFIINYLIYYFNYHKHNLF